MVPAEQKNSVLHDAHLGILEARDNWGRVAAYRKGTSLNHAQKDPLQLQGTHLVHCYLARRSGDAGWRKTGELAKDLVGRGKSLNRNEARLGSQVAHDDEGLGALQRKDLAVDAGELFENPLGQKVGSPSPSHNLA